MTCQTPEYDFMRWDADDHELRNRFMISCLKIEEIEDNEEGETYRRTEVDSSIEQCWKSVKEVFNETAKNVLGFKKRKSKS